MEKLYRRNWNLILLFVEFVTINFVSWKKLRPSLLVQYFLSSWWGPLSQRNNKNLKQQNSFAAGEKEGVFVFLIFSEWLGVTQMFFKGYIITICKCCVFWPANGCCTPLHSLKSIKNAANLEFQRNLVVRLVLGWIFLCYSFVRSLLFKFFLMNFTEFKLFTIIEKLIKKSKHPKNL